MVNQNTSPIMRDGKIDPALVRQRAIDNAVDIDTAKDRQGRTWVKDFPQFVRMPEGVSPAVPDGTVETRYVMRYANGKAEYVLDADSDGRAIGRLIHGAMDMVRPDLDDDGLVITAEDKSNAKQSAQAAAEAMRELEQSGSGVSVSSQQ